MLGVAAATAITGAAVAAGVAATAPSGPVGVVSGLEAVSHAGTARTAGHQGATADVSRNPAPAHHHGHAPAQAPKPRDGKARPHGAGRHHAPPAHRAGRHHANHHAAHRRPYLIYDSVTPSAIPRHHVIATYATGNYAVSRSQVANRSHVVWIDTTGSYPAASVLDVEPGDATPPMAANWAWHRLHAHPHALARIYTMRSQWPAVKAAIAHLPAHMRAQVRYWIADPTGVPHIVPGSAATQWYWGSSYDISTATPRF